MLGEGEGSGEYSQIFSDGFKDIAALFKGGWEGGTKRGESLGAGCGTESTGYFLTQFYHAEIMLGLIVGKGHVLV